MILKLKFSHLKRSLNLIKVSKQSHDRQTMEETERYIQKCLEVNELLKLLSERQQLKPEFPTVKKDNEKLYNENEKLVKENEMLRHKIMQMKSIGCHKCKDRGRES